MNILITGANGFIGRNLRVNLASIQDSGFNLLCYDLDNQPEDLVRFCQQADFVIHLAGVNRPQHADEFYQGNRDLTEQIIQVLESQRNFIPILLSSSTQAELDNDYGKSKLQAEGLVFAYGRRNQVPVYVYRLPGVFGKWCRPNYNSVVATFCHNIARGEQVVVNGRETALTLAYIDDVVQEFIAALRDKPYQNPDGYCSVPVIHQTTLGQLVDLIESFHASRQSLTVADMSAPFEKKLYSTYLSFLPDDGFAYLPEMRVDDRGSFTELVKTPDRGQVSVNIAKPGVTKGNHWHNTKNEKFIVVAGEAIIRFRQIGTDRIIEYAVSGDLITIVDIPVGYTHNITNSGDTDMVFIIWCNEVFDPDRPDTFYEEV